MSFISSFHDRYKDKVVVWERNNDGRRVIKEYNSPYYFYVPCKLGDYESVTGEKLKKLTFKNKSEFDQAVLSHSKRFESDTSPHEKVMMDNYAGKDAPKLVYGFVDIEVDYDPAVGWPRTNNPYAPVNALTLYKTDNKKYITLCVPPPGWCALSHVLPKEMLDDNYIICRDEEQLLEIFLQELESIDVISGWNSEFFDIPYLGKRIDMLFGSLGMKRLGFERAPAPRWTEAERFTGGAKEPVLDLNSRVHIDYMRLFKKLNLEGRQSHALAAIADDELDIPKLHYDGSLYELYRGSWNPNLNSLKPKEDIVIKSKSALSDEIKETVIKGGWDDLYTTQVERAIISNRHKEGYSPDIEEAYKELDYLAKQLSFEKFIFYNRRDVEIIVQIDEKFKYLEQANGMVHEATVGFNAIFGSVQLIDTAIINFCHLQLGKIVFDKTHRPKKKVEGALVLSPRIGLHRWIGSVDINSLYPSVYRSLNLSPEKIVGQLMGYEDDWKTIRAAWKNPDNDVYNNRTVTLRLEGSDDPDSDIILTAREMIDLLQARKFAVSGYGTILDQGNGEGLLPAVLSYWFVGRKEMQAKKKSFAKEADEILKINGGNKNDPKYIDAMHQSELYDLRQGIRKVLLNSSYGATLNEFCRFHDPRLGASTTGSGRQITTHMIETIATALIGDNAPKIKKEVITNKKGEIENVYTIDSPEGLGPIYSDTDSCYFVMDKLVSNGDEAVMCADAIADTVNASFNDFMKDAFFCQPEFADKIKAAREVVAVSGIFRAKKKYILFVYDLEGKKIDPDSPKSLKTQGSDIKISSTPEMIRGLLKEVTMAVLKGVDKKRIDDFIMEFRKGLNDLSTSDFNILDFATVTSVKTYDEQAIKWERIEKPGLGKVKGLTPAVRGAIYYNNFIKERNLNDERAIMAGDKVKTLWLKENQFGYQTFSFSSDVETLPSWFSDHFEVDIKLTEQKLIDKKLQNIFEPIGWQVPTLKTQLMNKLIEF